MIALLGKVALLLPLTGELASASQEFIQGFKAATESLDVVIWNTKASDSETVALLERINSDPDYNLVVGPLLSATALPAAEFAMRHRLPLIIPAAADLRLGTFGSYVFPFNYKDYMATAIVLDSVSKILGKEGWALLTEDSPEGRAAEAMFLRFAPEFGLELVGRWDYPSHPFSFDSLAELVLARNPRVIFIPVGSEVSGMLFLVLRKKGFRGICVGLGSWLLPPAAKWASDALGGLLVVAPKQGGFMERALAQATREELTEEYRKRHKRVPSELFFKGYDAGVLAAEATWGNPSRDEVKRRLLLRGVFRGTSGDIVLGKRPELFALYRLEGGSFIMLEEENAKDSRGN